MKKQLTSKQIYKRNQFKSKCFKTLAPITYWLFIGLVLIFGGLAIKNSIGNVTEIIQKLDKDTYTRQEISANYQELVEKWGEWTVVGYDGSAFEISFINISKALFSGLMKTYTTLTIVSFGLSIILGKIVFPKLGNYFRDSNQDMVNLATLDTQEIIKEKTKKKSETGGWF